MPIMVNAEFLPGREIAKLQQENWRLQREHVTRRSPFLLRLWGGHEIPESLAALADNLPLCDKAKLRESQAADPPFGDYLAAPPDGIVRMHRTSGTSGQAMNLALTASDARAAAVVGGRCQRASGLGPGHRVVHCLNYRLWMGGLTDHMTLEETGALVIPFGVGDSRLLLHTIREVGVTAISCTPSYPAVLERVLAEEFPDLAPRDLGLELGLFGGEAGLDSPDFRRRIQETWGLEPRNANYGVSDVFCNFAGQCEGENDLHFMAADVLYPELIEAASGACLPLREGETGELVLTHLLREAQPLVRFRTADIVTVTGDGPCPACGRTGFRFRVVGRSDDMVVVRGINVFPTMVSACVAAIEALGGEYQLRLPGPGPYDVLPLAVEAAPGRTADAALAEMVARAIKRDLGVTAKVTLHPFGSLPRTEGKTRRVIREDLP